MRRTFFGVLLVLEIVALIVNVVLLLLLHRWYSLAAVVLVCVLIPLTWHDLQ